MEKKVYNYKTVKYFSGSSVFIAIPFFIFGVGLLATPYFVFGIITLILLICILTTHYALEINLTDKTFRHYLWILGFKQTHTQTYDLIEYAFIQSSKVSRTSYSTATSNTFASLVYNGYLKFSDDTKIHLIQSPKKEIVFKKLKILAADLKIEIIDFTDADSVSIVP